MQVNLQSDNVSTDTLKGTLRDIFSTSTNNQAPTEASTDTNMATEASTVSQNTGTRESTEQGPNLGYLDLQASSGRFRLPNNAYDALRAETQTQIDNGRPAQQILESQLTLLERIPIFRDEIRQIRSRSATSPPVLSDTARDRLLRLPAAAIKAQARPEVSSPSSSSVGQRVYAQPSTTASTMTSTDRSHDTSQQPPSYSAPTREAPSQPSSPPTYSSSQHQSQRSDYVRTQKDREQAQREERERIKAQIKADREERRRQDEIRKMNEAVVDPSNSAEASAPAKSKSTDVRIQVRTFDGSTLRTNFPPTSTICTDMRPWIDQSTEMNVPYNLKLILTPLPNRNIEASEEQQTLSDLGIRGSGTLVMVPVKGYVESYTGSTPTGLIGGAVSGGYNLVTGAVGGILGGVKSTLGYGGQAEPQQPDSAPESAGAGQPVGQSQRNMRVRTLADQRLEDRGRDQQFYNGNALNFAPRNDNDDDDTRKND